ncbi:MAG: ABC transporter substrate-binding protein [Ilumatobacteraceae bacterium]
MSLLTSTMRTRVTRAVAVVTVALLGVSACGDDDVPSDATAAASTTAGPTASTPDTAPGTAPGTVPAESSPPETSADIGSSVEAANGTVTLDAQPVKIVSLSPTGTEMLFAIGAGEQVIAVDDQSNFPAEAEAVRSELSGYTPNVEAIAGYEPDLVVIADDFNNLGVQLAALDIPVWSGPTAMSLDDVYSQIEQLGTLTGHVADAAALVSDMRTAIEDELSELPESEVPLTYYHELDPVYFSVTSNTFIGQIYSLVGLRNIADQAEATSDYPQLSSELIVSSNPDLIFLADTKCCGESSESVASRDGWSGIAAVTNGAVIEMDDDIASRWGPRVVNYVAAVVDAVSALPQFAQG